MKPTIEDLQRLLLDARDEGQAEAPADPDPSYLIGCLQTCARFAHERARGGNWQALRLLALRALYLCALIAWKAGRRMAPVMQVNDGKGGLRPLEGPTAAETPAAKHDVEALLREVEQRFGRFREQEAPGDWAFGWTAERCAAELAATLRAERERAEALASVARGRERASGLAIDAHRHLRAVLDFMWPVGGWMTSPTVVQKARAFLAGDGQAEALTCNFCNGALDDQSFQGLADRVDEVQRLRQEIETWKRTTDRLRGDTRREREAHEQARREVLTEDEAHAHTRARLAEVERDLVEWKRVAGERSRETQIALAAQNRAESEAAGLRAQLVDLETAIRSLVDRVEKGRA
jgi:hypothetical protein